MVHTGFYHNTERLAERPRALWVVSTDRLDELVANSPVELGEIVTFVRGERSWRLTVPKDGHLPEGAFCQPLLNGHLGLIPALTIKIWGLL